MNDINLLPQRERKANNPRLILRIVAPLMVLLSCLGLFYGLIKPLSIKNRYAGILAALENESKDITQDYEALDRLSEELLDLGSRNSEFDEMDKGAPAQWLKILASLIDSLPYSTKINGILCDNSAIYLSGSSQSDVTTSVYIQNLKKSGVFESVTLERIDYSADNIGVTFRLICFLSDEQEVEHDQ